MKQRKIYGLIAITTVALVGLVVFQVYWINQSVQASRRQFEQQVYAALNTVVSQLEQQEAYWYAYRSVGPVEAAPPAGRAEVAPQSPNPLWRDQRSVVYRRGGQEVRRQTEIVISRLDSTHISQQWQEAGQQHKLENKVGMLENALQQLIEDNRPVQSRINAQQLPYLLDEALANRGINLPYQYAVVDARQDSVLLASTPSFFQKFDTDASVALFPNDFSPSNTFLTLEFPQQDWFLLRQIWLTLLASLLFTGIVIFCFVYAINTILKQKKLSEMKTDFINNMTHEFKTPISTVALAVEALQDQQVAQHPEFLARYLGIIREENARLGSQVEKVLQIATLDKKDFQLTLEPLNLHEIIQKAAASILPVVQKREGKMTQRLNATQPIVSADRHHLTNIITNLIDNANKYSPESPVITIRTEDDAQGITLSVTDRGMGMSKEELGRVFEKFYRVPTGNRHDVKGFGLGLSYVKSMVEAHQGRVLATSTLGKGSTFTVYLPYEQQDTTGRR